MLDKLNIDPGKEDEFYIDSSLLKITYNIGSGHFGTVFGGHVVRTDDNNVQYNEPVAIKSIKKDSTIAKIFDFLCEVQLMKRLEHPNIVKITGMSADDFYIYLAMERMTTNLELHVNELRHLGNAVETAHEVHPERLTRIVLDIARGLTYLAEQKLVHRDIACRNCLLYLVNGECTVKIADFGLTRELPSDDIYQLSRTDSEVPFEYLAPESRAHPHPFSTASDIWAFGIVIWQIITLGDFPRVSISNDVVNRYIFELGRHPSANEILVSLLRQCWHPDYTQRISAAEIAELLTNHPQMITPCVFGISQMTMQDGYQQITPQIDVSQYIEDSESNAQQFQDSQIELLGAPRRESNKHKFTRFVNNMINWFKNNPDDIQLTTYKQSVETHNQLS